MTSYVQHTALKMEYDSRDQALSVLRFTHLRLDKNDNVIDERLEIVGHLHMVSAIPAKWVVVKGPNPALVATEVVWPIGEQ